MKKYISIFAAAFLLSISFAYSQGGLQGIRFTAKANAVNGLDIYAENITASAISGTIGEGELSLCVLVPASVNPQPTVAISSTISGLTFGPVVSTTETTVINSATYYVYTFNGATFSSSVTFTPNTEILIATYSFTGVPLQTSSVLLAMLPAGGPANADYCYIAPNGTDETDYSNPFYSDITSDPGLHNANGANDISLNGLSYLSVVGVTLPIKFTGFTATKNEDNALLNWAVTNEGSSTDHYEVERSLDGTTFTDVASVAVKGNGSNNTYSYTDENLSSLNSTGVIDYRIEQVGTDGTTNYTTVQAVRLTNGIVITTYPNPVSDIVWVKVNLLEASNISIDLSDMSGKNLQRLVVAGAKGDNLNQFDMKNYASGSYLLKITSTTEVVTKPIVKN